MALLLATPALGTVTITCSHEGDGVIRVDYAVAGESAKVRAFALDVSVDSSATIDVVYDFQTGEGNKYGIFPGTIDLTDPEDPDWGSPVAPSSDPGAEGTGEGFDRVILEMGSLYEPNLAGPSDTGLLCRFDVSGDCNVAIVVETTRGGVVLENGSTVSIESEGCSIDIVDIPECWTYSTQCHGDTDGDCDVDTTDWPTFRDGFGKAYPAQDYIDNLCADFDHDGDVDTADWPEFRDNFGKNCGTGLLQDCPGTGTWPPS